MQFLTSEQIKNFEGKIITDLSSSLSLINNAANACVKELMPFDAICVFCGGGNNGADGYRLARLLKGKGKTVFTVKVTEPKTTECKVLAERCREAGISSYGIDKALEGRLPKWDAAADAVFGIGIRGTLEGNSLDAVRFINSRRGFVLSVDIPSGLNADTGRPCPEAVRADKTVTFTAPKMGMINGESADYCGEIVIADAGIAVDEATILPPQPYPLTMAHAAALLPVRSSFSNKGSFGRVLMFAGSPGMAGAAAMAASAAVRSGCGLVSIVCLDGLENTLNLLAPEAVVIPVKKYSMEESALKQAVKAAKAILIGCGIGRSIPAEFIKEVISGSDCPVILDADGLNTLSPFREGLDGGRLILTPHPLEFSRLTGLSVEDIEKGRIEAAESFARRFALTLVLKGARTLITDGKETYVSLISTSALAKGGSGDILSGVISALCAQGIPPAESGRLGVFIHSLSGRITARMCGEYSASPKDITENLKYAFTEVQRYE